MAWVSVVTGRQGEAGRPGSGGAGPGGVRARARVGTAATCKWRPDRPDGTTRVAVLYGAVSTDGWMMGRMGEDGSMRDDDDVAAASSQGTYVRTSAPRTRGHTP